LLDMIVIFISFPVTGSYEKLSFKMYNLKFCVRLLLN